ncbi:ATP-grasp domain-containing protein [Cereibacter sphaeroides]|uniref:ATP-grasp domain-containing protein n=1 Tax=Cereibacter sphaeroides TaxID=1063 RepID=UPI001F4699D5|nr:ATP-grasp domain-containing protein [Cereibacter sphaeroides]MCE6958809.1 ATP-grasp domain-containing protein [Cereibacter sphaeroides]MCE6973317.1 ATP-grasp domain-containing protein [Cereibacter sphaeroides]
MRDLSRRSRLKDRLAALDAAMATRDDTRPVLFVSLDAARFVERTCPALRRGLILDREKLRVHRWSGFLPAELLLNRSFVLLPFGALASRAEQMHALFGERLFLRPDSAMKEFPGQVVAARRLGAETAALGRLHHIDRELLCVVDRAQELPLHEWRFWLADGGIVTCAPYAFGPGGVNDAVAAPPCPTVLRDAARRAALALEIWENPVVADLVVDAGGEPRLVEINGFSTSGFYPGLDAAALDGIMA